MNTSYPNPATQGSAANEYEHRSIWGYFNNLAFTQGYVDAGGIKTRYVQAGPKNAPAVIMMHGMGGSWENCFANIGAHSAHFNTFAFDFVGHGFSDKPDKTLEISDYVDHLANFMDAMGISRASLLGVSLGGWVSTKFVMKYPERVDKIVIVSAWGRRMAASSESKEASRKMLESARAARMDSVNNPSWASMEQVFAGLLSNPKDRIPDLLAIRQAIYRQPEMKKGMTNIWNGVEPDAYARNAYTDEELSKIRQPVMIVAAIDEKDTILETAYANAKVLPNVKLVEMTGVSHWSQWEGVDEFNPLSIQFLRAN